MEGKLEQLKSDLQEYLKKNPQFTLAEIFTEYKSEGKTLLHIAASSGRDDVMDYVIDNIPSLSEVINMPDQRGFTPLIYAVIGSSSGILQRLLTLNAEVNAVNDDGAAAIHFAAGDGSVDKLKMLIDHKANLLLMSKSGSVLHWAASEGHGKAIGFLLEKGLDPNMSRLPNVPGESESSDDHPPVAPAVMLAAVSGTDIGVRALVEAGADVGHIIQGNNTVLHIAAENGLLTACKAIVASPLGAKLCSMETSDTNLPVHLAAMAGHREIVEILLDVSLPHLSSLLKVRAMLVYSDDDDDDSPASYTLISNLYLLNVSKCFTLVL
jgi:ankyrin repeat protein